MDGETAAAADGKTTQLVLRQSSLELWLGVIIIATACAFLWEAVRLPPALSKTDVGAGQFPTIVGIATLALAVMLALKALAVRYLSASDTLVTIDRPGPVGLAIVATIIQTTLFGIIGAYPTCILIVGSLMLISGERRWWPLLYVPVLYAVLIYLCFGLLLGVRFP